MLILESWRFPTGGWVKSVDISGDARIVVAGSYDTYLYFLEEGKLAWKFSSGKDDAAMSVALDESGSPVLLGSHDGKLYLLDRNGSKLWHWRTEGRFNAVMSSCLNSSRDRLVLGCNDGSVYMLDLNSNIIWRYLPTGMSRGYIWSVGMDSHCSKILVGSYGNQLLALSSDGAMLWKFFREPRNAAMHGSISRDGKYVLGCSDDRNVYLLDSEGELIWSRSLRVRAKSSSITENARYLAVGGFDGFIYIFDRDGEIISEYQPGAGYIWDLKFSRDARFLAVGCSDRNVYLLRLKL